MRYQSSLAFTLAFLWSPFAYCSVSEVEPNSAVAGVRLVCDQLASDNVTCSRGSTIEIDNTGQPNPAANDDPTYATTLPLNDEIVGQLSGTRDYDWFYVDIPDSSRPVTPVYFGCDQKQGFYQETAPGSTLTLDPVKDITYQVNYYYQNPSNPSAGAKLQSSYVVGPDSCKMGTAETIGHMRFQMNTQRPGRYYVRIFGRYIGAKDKDNVTYDEIVAPTGDYSLRVYTDRVTGEQEPNDGSVEAYPLVSGMTTSGQLSTMYDQDWFAIDNDVAVNTSKKIPFYFTCNSQTGTYNVSAYDYLGVLQANYQVTASQCSKASGFSFSLNAPITARYYFVISPPTYTDTAQFTQSDYTVLAIASPNSAIVGTPTRLPGELEPNDSLVNAYPITATQPVTGAQISSVEDLDYYYYENNSSANPGGTTPIYFQCSAAATSGVVYTLTTFNPLGTLQKSYAVDASQCNVPGGFKFEMSTPSTARYYVLVSETSTIFSGADYILSTSYIMSGDASGNLNTARITTHYTPAGADNFAIKIGKCGTKKGTIKLTGKKLNLTGINANSQVNVKIGSWSCVSNAKTLSINTSDPTQKTLVYPPPPAPVTPAPAKPKISGK
jgi:hypothetical protein